MNPFKVYNSIHFQRYIQPWNLHQSRCQTSENILISVEGFLAPLRSPCPHPLHPHMEALSCFLSLQIPLHFLAFHINGITVFGLLHKVSFTPYVSEIHPCAVAWAVVHPLSWVSSVPSRDVSHFGYSFSQSSFNHTLQTHWITEARGPWACVEGS